MKALLLGLSLGLALATAALAEPTPRLPALSPRKKQEYDALGYDPGKVFVAFTQLKRAFARHDLDAFAKLCTFPLTISRKNGPSLTLEDARGLRGHKDLIFSPHNAQVVKAQSFATLSLRDEGAMVGDLFLISGACTDGDGKPCAYGILSVNVP
jgi:hypothetical protein